jgi:chitodextrinase
MKRFTFGALAAIAALTFPSCTVHQTDPLQPSGPSELAFSLSLQALPDAIRYDGGDQSTIRITAKGPDGKGISGATFRVDIIAGGIPNDYGRLSSRTPTTDSNGVATVMYTAPLLPPGGDAGTCSGLPGTCVLIVATPVSTNFITSTPQTVTIRLMPTGTVLPPAGPPTAVFAYSPSPAVVGTSLLFDGSRSTPGVNATSIAAYDWSFGDGSTASGPTVSHTFRSISSYQVTLTVTSDRGLTASTTIAVDVNAATVPTANIDTSPSTIHVGNTVNLSGLQSTAAPGRTIVRYDWVFGDGTANASGPTVNHVYTSANTFTVTLTVTDDIGQTNSTTATVTVQ